MARYLFALFLCWVDFCFVPPHLPRIWGWTACFWVRAMKSYRMYRAIGAGLAVIGAAIGIGRIGGSACESIARTARDGCQGANRRDYFCCPYRRCGICRYPVVSRVLV